MRSRKSAMKTTMMNTDVCQLRQSCLKSSLVSFSLRHFTAYDARHTLHTTHRTLHTAHCTAHCTLHTTNYTHTHTHTHSLSISLSTPPTRNYCTLVASFPAARVLGAIDSFNHPDPVAGLLCAPFCTGWPTICLSMRLLRCTLACSCMSAVMFGQLSGVFWSQFCPCVIGVNPKGF